MAFSLYDASVANYLQILGSVGGYLDKSLTHFRDKGVDPAKMVEAKLAPDMLPLRFQIVSVAHHSRGAMDAAKNGVFSPPSAKPDLDYAGLQALVTEARDELARYHLAHSARADLCRRLGRVPEARASYEKALALIGEGARQEPERRFLLGRLEELKGN